MARKSYSAEQLRIQREITRLQKRADVLQQKQRAPAMTQILRTMREFGITPDDIAAAFTKRTRGQPTARKTVKTTSPKHVNPPKYRDPASGNTWTGRGKPPRWIAAADQAGTGREQFLINP